MNQGRLNPKYCTIHLNPGSASTCKIDKVVAKVTCVLDNENDETGFRMRLNADTVLQEANAYTILGHHPRIANCIFICISKSLVLLEYYEHGNLKEYIKTYPPDATDVQKWARQMVEGVDFMHSKGIIHCDLRLEQWMVDSNLNVRLSDFNGCNLSDHPHLLIKASRGQAVETATHFLPREYDETGGYEEGTVKSDLFALGSSLYELEKGEFPWAEICTWPFGLDDEITEKFARGEFPPAVLDLKLGGIILKCWKQEYDSATDILQEEELAIREETPQCESFCETFRLRLKELVFTLALYVW